MNKQQPSKSPLRAAALNLVPMGYALGYAYLDCQTRLKWALALQLFAFSAAILLFLNQAFNCGVYDSCLHGVEVFYAPLAPYAVVLLVSALDAYLVGLLRD